MFIKLLNKTRVRYARECRYLHANTETRESFRINALAINEYERLSGSRFTKDHAGSMDSKEQPSPRTNFSGDSLHRRFVLRAVALKFFDKTNFARMEVTQSRFGFRETQLCRNTRETNSIRAIVRGERSNSPIDEGWRFRRLQHDAGQIDVAPAFDVELRITVDLCLRDCTRGQNKVKVVFGRGRAPAPAPTPAGRVVE